MGLVEAVLGDDVADEIVIVPEASELLLGLHGRLSGTEGGFELGRWRSGGSSEPVDLTAGLAVDPSEGPA